MKLLTGGTISLPAYFESSDGTPATGQTLSNVLFDINYLDGTSPSAGNAANRELGDGWYAYDFTDTQDKSFVYIAKDDTATYKNFPGGLVEIVKAEGVGTSKNHPDSTSAELVFSISISEPTRIESIFIDLSSLTQNTIIAVTHQTDTASDTSFWEYAWTPTTNIPPGGSSDWDNIWVPPFTAIDDVAVYLTSAVGEGGGGKLIYYAYTKVVL